MEPMRGTDAEIPTRPSAMAYATGPDSEVGNLWSETQMLANEIEQTGALVARLEDRLNAVMTPDEPRAEHDELVPDRHRSPLGDTQLMHARMLRGMNERMRRLLDRLDV